MTASRTFVQLSINKGVRVLESVKSYRACEKVLELSRVVELGVSIQQEVHRSSSSCPQDWRYPSSGYVYRSRDWEIYQIHWIRRCIVKDRAKPPYHLVSERQVDHGAVQVVSSEAILLLLDL